MSPQTLSLQRGLSKIDYKKELETASRGMIMIHDPRLLIKLMIRMIVRKLGVKHAAMVLYEPERDTYVLSISRGERGMRIPPGFTRFSHSSPIIKLFQDPHFRPLRANRNAILLDDINRMVWQETVLSKGSLKNAPNLLHRVEEEMTRLNTVACVPSFYRDKLMAVLLLGEKYDEKRFNQEELDFFAALASDGAMAIRNAQLFESLKEEAERNRKLFIQTIVVLSSTIEAKDAYTHGHTERVTRYAVSIAKKMAEDGVVLFPEGFFENLYIGGLLHDIGKIAIPESILLKKGPLTEEEYCLVQKHPLKGAEIINSLTVPEDCVNCIKYHHERYDGSGYPFKLAGPNIPIAAAIIAVADAFDAMTTDRPYRKGFDKVTALQELQKNSGTQFHPLVVESFHAVFKQENL
ncbi:MAG: HD domain-containing protein [Candidatus Omnitrophica bacterium]|nr:HD domain-containing protein [Candidatus Omnitrophota bacterium]